MVWQKFGMLVLLIAMVVTKWVDCRIYCNNYFLQLYPELGCNLTELTISEPIMELKKFQTILKDPKIPIMRAQLTVGQLNGKPPDIAIGGFPSANTSDLSLEMFLQGVEDYNNQSFYTDRYRVKNTKLKFAETEGFKAAVDVMTRYYEKQAFVMVINADIIAGPGNPMFAPVDPDIFLAAMSSGFEDAILSIGWTSDSKGEPLTHENHIAPMIEAIERHKIKQTLTFPVRAGNAASSIQELLHLLNLYPNSTLSIWSTTGDHVDHGKLRELIVTVGWDLCILDLSRDVRSALFKGWKFQGPKQHVKS